MFFVSKMHEDNIVENVVVVPILSYEDYVTCVSKMKQDDTHMMFIDGVLCYLTPYDGEDGIHTWLKIKTHSQDGDLISLVTVIVVDKTRPESLIMVDNVPAVEEIGLLRIVEEVNNIIQSYL